MSIHQNLSGKNLLSSVYNVDKNTNTLLWKYIWYNIDARQHRFEVLTKVTVISEARVLKNFPVFLPIWLLLSDFGRPKIRRSYIIYHCQLQMLIICKSWSLIHDVFMCVIWNEVADCSPPTPFISHELINDYN